MVLVKKITLLFIFPVDDIFKKIVSQVDFDNPDFEKFPKLPELRGQQAILAPGDVLYLPVYW